MLDSVNTISAALREQSAAIDLIAGSVEQVASKNGDNATVVHGMAQDARMLQSLAEQLKAKVSSFTLR